MPKGVYPRRPRLPKQYPEELVSRCRELYQTGHTQDEVAVALGVSQRVIWRLMKHHGIPARTAAKRDQRGERNDYWGGRKGSPITYSAYHYRVQAARGTPQECEECGATDGDRSYDWANMTGRYDDLQDYRRLCRSCHWKRDGTFRNFGPYLKGARKEVQDAR